MRVFVTGLALIVFVILSADEGDKRIVVKGFAVGELPDVRDEALKDALRKAVEQGVGVIVTSHSEVRDYQLVFEQILTEAAGYVKTYTIKSEGYEGEKRYAVEVDAVVSTAEIKGDWAALKTLIQQKGNPTFLVAVIDKVDGEPEKGSSIAQSEITAFMLSKDIQMVNQKIADEALKKETEAARIAGDKDKLVALAKKLAADMVIIGSVESTLGNSVDFGGGRVRVRYNVTVALEAVRADDGIVVAVANETPQLDADSCSGWGKREAALKALKSGAKAAAENALSEILKKWQKELLTGAPITLEVKNITFPKAKQLQDALKKIRFTTIVKMDFSSNFATIYLKTPFVADKFLDKMLALKVVKDTEVTDLGRNKITIEKQQE
ncbi:MAG: hypothetical protein N2234_07645 [Planctomycetota bacterium]|nr:hypothetical protein [Planctomycetota bacterium]